MRSYRIDMEVLVNRLVPHYLGGRRLILLLQSLLKPLDTLNRQWKEWADTKRIEAAMTSQVIMMEYYLNRKFGKYFRTGRISISDGDINGVAFYWESVGATLDSCVMHTEAEGTATVFRWKDEKTVSSDVSFVINCPVPDESLITGQELAAMIIYSVRRYCVAGKKFIVIYN